MMGISAAEQNQEIQRRQPVVAGDYPVDVFQGL